MDPNVLRLAMGAGGAGGDDYKLWAWGRGLDGALGDGTTVSKSSPIQVGSLTDWSLINAGNLTSLAVKTDGTLWAWGYNGAGLLGDGTTTNKSSPVQIGGLTNWAKLPVGGLRGLATHAIKTDGTLWAWGYNSMGQLGDGTTVAKSSPIQIGSGTNWNKTSNGYNHSLAIKTDGTLWAWGFNNFGQLGLGDVTNRSSPVQVGALTNWASIVGGFRHSLAVKTDGTLWAWGRNKYGQLGDGTAGTGYDKSSPVQIGSLTTWSKVAAGSNFSAAIKTDGTLWTWGIDEFGQLGIGQLYPISKSSPVQVGALTNWSEISLGANFCLAKKTDGTVWAWGHNNHGQLGDGTTTNKSSPVQIGSAINWYSAVAGYQHSLAITKN